MKSSSRNTQLLASGFGLILLLMILIVALSIARIEQSRRILQESIAEHQGCIDLIDKMYSASRQRIVVLQKIATERDPFIQDEIGEQFRKLASDFIEARQALLLRELNEEELQLMEVQRNIANQIVPLQAEVIELALRDKHIKAQLMLVNDVVPAHSEMLETLVALSSRQTVELRRAMDETHASESETIILLVVAGATTVLLAIMVAIYVERGMRRLTNNLSQTATDLRESLRELQYQKQALDEHAIVSVTDAKGVLKYVNDKFCRISQYPLHGLVGNTHRIINSGVHSREFFAEFWKIIQSGKVWHGQLCNRRKDGSVYWMDTTVVPFLDETGMPYQYIGVQTDISAAKEAEAVLARGKVELEQLVAERTQELQERHAGNYHLGAGCHCDCR